MCSVVWFTSMRYGEPQTCCRAPATMIIPAGHERIRLLPSSRGISIIYPGKQINLLISLHHKAPSALRQTWTVACLRSPWESTMKLRFCREAPICMEAPILHRSSDVAKFRFAVKLRFCHEAPICIEAPILHWTFEAQTWFQTSDSRQGLELLCTEFCHVSMLFIGHRLCSRCWPY